MPGQGQRTSLAWMTLKSSVVIFQALKPLQSQWPQWPQQPQWPQWPQQPHFIKQLVFYPSEPNQKISFNVRHPVLRIQGQLNQHCNLNNDFSDIMNVSLHAGYPGMHSLVLERLPAKMVNLTKVLIRIYAVNSFLALFFSILGNVRFHQRGLGK